MNSTIFLRIVLLAFLWVIVFFLNGPGESVSLHLGALTTGSLCILLIPLPGRKKRQTRKNYRSLVGFALDDNNRPLVGIQEAHFAHWDSFFLNTQGALDYAMLGLKDLPAIIDMAMAKPEGEENLRFQALVESLLSAPDRVLLLNQRVRYTGNDQTGTIIHNVDARPRMPLKEIKAMIPLYDKTPLWADPALELETIDEEQEPSTDDPANAEDDLFVIEGAPTKADEIDAAQDSTDGLLDFERQGVLNTAEGLRFMQACLGAKFTADDIKTFFHKLSGGLDPKDILVTTATLKERRFGGYDDDQQQRFVPGEKRGNSFVRAVSLCPQNGLLLVSFDENLMAQGHSYGLLYREQKSTR